jgi:hypothetical protein
MEDKDGVGYMSRSSGLFHLEASRVRVFQSVLRTGGGAARIVHVASSWRSHGAEAEDRRIDAMGYIGLFYPNFAIFIILGPGAVFSFSLLLRPINRTLGGWSSLSLLLVSFCIS